MRRSATVEKVDFKSWHVRRTKIRVKVHTRVRGMKIGRYLTMVPNGIYDVHVKLTLFKILDFFCSLDSR